MSPASYMKSKNDCPYCAGTGKKTTPIFVKECLSKFPDKNYDYSKVNYVNAQTPVIITCPIHGDFEKIPYSFLQGHLCPSCGIEERNRKNSLTLEEFITKAREVHGDVYDYSKVEYKNNRTKVWIICPEHGEFYQTPDIHLSGCGCPECAKLSTEDFIRNARKVHGSEYDYSKVIYTRSTDKVLIICPKHGEFRQTASSHLAGTGCPKCATEKCKLTKEQFINNSKYMHGDLYDYSEVNYVNSHTPVTIICKQHGRFNQLPSNHMQGAGCPLCNKTSEGEITVMNILNKEQIEYIPQYKVHSKVNPSGFMYVDFYLPKFNIFIEYNGRQHYAPVEVMGGLPRFEIQKARDEELRQYCKDNDIKLIEIRYDEDVWEVLNEKLLTTIMTNKYNGNYTA